MELSEIQIEREGMVVVVMKLMKKMREREDDEKRARVEVGWVRWMMMKREEEEGPRILLRYRRILFLGSRRAPGLVG